MFGTHLAHPPSRSRPSQRRRHHAIPRGRRRIPDLRWSSGRIGDVTRPVLHLVQA